jgi:hypothetical protein
VLGNQDHPLGQGGHRGQYLILKTIPWDKMDIEVSALVLKTIPWDKMDIEVST